MRTPQIILLACVLLAAAAWASPADSSSILQTPLPAPETVPATDPGSLIKRFVTPLTQEHQARDRAILQSDREHADSIGPVLLPGVPAYIHRSTLPGMGMAPNFLLVDGRIFCNYDESSTPKETPSLFIRPVDGGTRIPFLLRAELIPRAPVDSEGDVEFNLRLPTIFNPRIQLDGAFIDGRKALYRIIEGSLSDSWTISLRVSPSDFETARKAGKPGPVILLHGSATLDEYNVIANSNFIRPTADNIPASLSGIARLIQNRDYTGDQEKNTINQIVTSQLGNDPGPISAMQTFNRYLGSNLRYYRNNMKRTALQVLIEGIGDCDDYARVLTVFLRAIGIPCKPAIGSLYDFNNAGAHAWIEAALPTRGKQTHWFIVDPTLASAAEDKNRFVQFKNRIYFYPVGADISILNLPTDYSTDLLLNWEDPGKSHLSAQVMESTIHDFIRDLQGTLTQERMSLDSPALPFRREFMFSNGSPYLLLDRPVRDELDRFSKSITNPDLIVRNPQEKDPPEKARFQIKLDSHEDLLLELGVIDDDFDLDGVKEKRVIAALENLYDSFKKNLFNGTEARYCLEKVYIRDRNTDRLQKVRVRIGRYLMEKHLKNILATLEKDAILAHSESDSLEKLYQQTKGKNLYHLLELHQWTPKTAQTPAARTDQPPVIAGNR